jgi:hypothetical protein
MANVTHYLNIRISNEKEKGVGLKIRKDILNKINGIPMIENINNTDVTITWHTDGSIGHSLYFANVELFNNLAVKLHTNALFKKLYNTNYELVDIHFVIFRPLMREIPLIEEDYEITHD